MSPMRWLSPHRFWNYGAAKCTRSRMRSPPVPHRARLARHESICLSNLVVVGRERPDGDQFVRHGQARRSGIQEVQFDRGR